VVVHNVETSEMQGLNTLARHNPPMAPQNVSTGPSSSSSSSSTSARAAAPPPATADIVCKERCGRMHKEGSTCQYGVNCRYAHTHMARSYRVPCQLKAAGAASPRTGGCASSVETPGMQCTYNKNVKGAYKIGFLHHVHDMCAPWTRVRHREHGKIGSGEVIREGCNGEEGRGKT
jgi:hypothetical protein